MKIDIEPCDLVSILQSYFKEAVEDPLLADTICSILHSTYSIPQKDHQDACPQCLGNLYVVMGIILKKRNPRKYPDQKIYTFKCPQCFLKWECMFKKYE